MTSSTGTSLQHLAFGTDLLIETRHDFSRVLVWGNSSSLMRMSSQTFRVKGWRRSAPFVFGARSFVTIRALEAAISCLARSDSRRRRCVTPVLYVDGLDFDIRNAGEVALGPEEIVFVLSIKICGIDRTGEVGDEHLVAGNVDCDADSLHEMRDQNFRLRL